MGTLKFYKNSKKDLGNPLHSLCPVVLHPNMDRSGEREGRGNSLHLKLIFGTF